MTKLKVPEEGQMPRRLWLSLRASQMFDPVDPVPIEVPVEFAIQSPEDRIRELIRSEMSRAAEVAGAETFEEANDLDFVEDEMEPVGHAQFVDMAFDPELDELLQDPTETSDATEQDLPAPDASVRTEDPTSSPAEPAAEDPSNASTST